MKAEPILAETFRIKEILAARAGFSVQRLCEQIEKSMSLHPSPAHQVFSAEDLAALVAREEPARLAAIPAECLQTYRRHDPIIAEIHLIRERLAREHKASALVFLKEEPPRKP